VRDRTVATAALGPIGRLGRFAATHRAAVFATWAVVAVGLGFLAPRVETALSGAGWEATGERFIDPETGKQVTVYYDPKSGQRQYVKE